MKCRRCGAKAIKYFCWRTPDGVDVHAALCPAHIEIAKVNNPHHVVLPIPIESELDAPTGGEEK